MEIWEDDQHCFVCGSLNPSGLKLTFLAGPEGVLLTHWTTEKRFQGYAGVLHGGIISTILDEVMINLPWKLYDAPVTTAELTVRFRKPVPIGCPLVFTAKVQEKGRRLWKLEAECRGEDDQTIYAEASAKAMTIQFQPYQGPRP